MDTRFMLTILCVLLSIVAFASSENCPKGWHFYNQRKRCFLLDSEPLPWEQARDKCEGHGGDLTVIPDNETNAFIKGLIEPSCAEYWIGLHDRPSEGVFQWLDQAGETNFSYWAPNEPNNFGDEDCVVITAAKESQWNDAKCTAYLGFSCEIEAENRSFCTGPKHENFACPTTEPEKLTSQTPEPMPTTSTGTQCPKASGFHLIKASGKELCVGYFNEGVSYFVAKSRCLTKGAHLLHPDSSAKFIAAGLILYQAQGSVWVGITDRFQEGQWVYELNRQNLNSETVHHWKAGEPNGGYGSEDFGQLQKELPGVWRLDDVRVDHASGYICEIP